MTSCIGHRLHPDHGPHNCSGCAMGLCDLCANRDNINAREQEARPGLRCSDCGVGDSMLNVEAVIHHAEHKYRCLDRKACERRRRRNK